MNIVHMYFEVVISCKLLMTKMALCHWAVRIVSHLVSDKHFLQAKSQVTNLEKNQIPHIYDDKSVCHIYNMKIHFIKYVLAGLRTNYALRVNGISHPDKEVNFSFQASLVFNCMVCTTPKHPLLSQLWTMSEKQLPSYIPSLA